VLYSLRVYAIYARSPWILAITIPVYLGQLAVMGWSIPAGVVAHLPPGFIGCVPSEKPGIGIRLSGIYIAAVCFDATIFILTAARALYLRFTSSALPLIALIVRDGTMYFLVIFVVNLANVILLSLVPPDLSAINAPFATMITAVLVARYSVLPFTSGSWLETSLIILNSLMFNLCAAGSSRLQSSGKSDSYQMNPVGHARIARPPIDSGGTSWQTGTSNTRAATSSQEKDQGQHGIGTMSFHDMIGLDEFDVPLRTELGKEREEDEGGAHGVAWGETGDGSEYVEDLPRAQGSVGRPVMDV